MDTKTRKNNLLHYTMSFVGEIFAIYSLLERSNVFGSAETSNMILLVNDFLKWDIFHIITQGTPSNHRVSLVQLYCYLFLKNCLIRIINALKGKQSHHKCTYILYLQSVTEISFPLRIIPVKTPII